MSEQQQPEPQHQQQQQQQEQQQQELQLQVAVVSQQPAQIVVTQQEEREWSTGLCSCCSDMKSCKMWHLVLVSIPLHHTNSRNESFK